ncbi:SRPBCC family protein [Salinibacterium sp. G-O1]|uniref:SRPBCC family protein n=1 Tax=Salinibacterium sp. G-O1 TaxID=3046208 RepID=UPI0024B8BCFC|nr:SRPBCC family protein [Salinibacterium sp. G-O1]MDJ0336445.1 SRPBCC family protein [Salinibacterium sp. G-O1]
MKIQSSVDVDAAPEKVFAVFSDLDVFAAEVPGITKVEILAGPVQMQAGTKWRETRIMFGKEATEEMWVTAIEQDASYVVEAESHGTHYRSEYLFTPVGSSTRVQMTFEGRPLTFGASVGSLLMVFFAGATKKALLKDMLELKRVCEAA